MSTVTRKLVADIERARDLTSSQRTRQNKQDKISRHARAQAQNIQRGDTPPPDLPTTPVLSPPDPAPAPDPVPDPPITIPPTQTAPSLPTLRDRIEQHELSLPAISEQHWDYVTSYHQKLCQKRREVCDICSEIGFEMNLRREGPDNDLQIYPRCLKDRQKRTHHIDLFSAANNMDPGPVPQHLPQLSMAAELLVARAHITMSLWRYRGQQYQYSGHIVSYMQNVPKIVSRLPSLPSKLQILRLKPARFNPNQTVQKDFERQCRVKRADIEVWLKYLIQHHPDYKDIVIDAGRLSALPEDGSVLDELSSTQSVTSEGLPPVQPRGEASTTVSDEDQTHPVGVDDNNGTFLALCPHKPRMWKELRVESLDFSAKSEDLAHGAQ